MRQGYNWAYAQDSRMPGRGWWGPKWGANDPKSIGPNLHLDDPPWLQPRP